MSVETVKQFMEKASKDEGLAGKLKEAGTDVNDMIALGKEQGCEFTAQDIVDTSAEFTGGKELSDEELENVAGGFGGFALGAIPLTAIISAGAAIVGELPRTGGDPITLGPRR